MSEAKSKLEELKGRTVAAIIANLIEARDEKELANSNLVRSGYDKADADQRIAVDGLVRALTGHSLGEIIAVAGDQKPLVDVSISLQAGSQKAS